MPKLYAFILKYLSNESLEAVKKDANWDAIEEGTNPEGLWKAVIEKHKVHSACEVESITQLSARVQLHQCKQGSFESIICISSGTRMHCRPIMIRRIPRKWTWSKQWISSMGWITAEMRSSR
jgi:hypothetical protein